MKTIDVLRTPKELWLGRDSENNFRPVAFDCSGWLAKYTDGTIAVYYQPKGATDPYPVNVEMDGTTAVWYPTETELVEGEGELQIALLSDGVVGTSAIISCKVDRSLISSAQHPPDTAPSWAVQVVEDVTEQADRAESAADRAEAAADGIEDAIDEAVPEAVADYMEEHPVTVSDAVLYTDQSLTDAQKAQARTNIGAYTKPSGGIPASDLASGVIPTVSVQSVNGKTGAVTLDGVDVGVLSATSVSGKNRANPAEFEEGVYITSSGSRGTSASYTTTGYIPVSPGEVIRGCYINTAGDGAQSILGMRWISAYDANKAVMSAAGTDTTCQTFTVPDGVAYIRVCYHSATYGTTIMIEANPDRWSAYEAYGASRSLYLASDIRVAADQVDEATPEATAATGIRYAFDLDANGFDGEESIEDLADYAIVFRAPVDSSFEGATVARGYQSYQGGYVVVTPTMLEVYLDTNATASLSVAHGLTLADYLYLRIEVGHDFKADITIGTNGGVFTRGGVSWPVRVGTLSVLPVGNTDLSGCELSYFCEAWNAETQLYGDSYFSVDSTQRWTSYLYKDGYSGFLLNAFSGRHAAQGLAAAKIVLAHSYPKRVIWCLGMNNGDNGAVNAGWLAATEELMEICEERGIELILATIPNIPTMDNTYKNAYVRESGLRYIDFAAAVGAESDTTWYDDMLSTDGVHPDTPGALALYRQALADVPELMQKTDTVAASELPAVTASDNGKFLRVVSGAWAAEAVPAAEGVSF